MLTEHDIAIIKETRKEITQNRTEPITLIGERRTGEHPITKEPITEEVKAETIAVIYEITSTFKFDRDLDEGVDVQNGDLWIDVDISDLVGGFTPDEILSVEYRGINHTVMSADSVGLGRDNRVEIIARRTK